MGSSASAPNPEAARMAEYSLECKLRSIFRRFDLDSDGHISVNEMEAMIRSLTDGAGLGSPDWDANRQVGPLEDAKFIVGALDTDKNGQIEESEFVNWIHLGLSRSIKTRKSYSKKNDRNHRLENFLGIIESIPPEEVDDTLISAITKDQMGTVFDSFDEDKDGHITLREVKSMFTELKLRTSIGTGSIQTDTEDAQILLGALDSNGNGQVEKEEFVEWAIRGLGRPLRERVAWANRSLRNRRLDHFLRAVSETASGSLRRSEQRRHLRKMFFRFDSDHDGHLTTDELVAMFTEIRLMVGIGPADITYAKSDASAIIAAMDNDGNGMIEEDEFINWMNDGMTMPKSSRSAFASTSDFNRRTTSFLSAVEAYIKRILLLEPDNQAMINTRLRKVFQRFDCDRDGNISSEEAQTMVNALLGAGPQNDDPIYLEAGKKMVRALDYTGDGGIDEDEFVSWVTTGMTRTGDERAQFSKRGPVNVLLLRLLDAITDECLNQKITLGEVNKEKKKILIKKKAKDSEARSATNVSSEKGAVDVDDGFALGEIQEMSFGSGMTIAAGGGSFTGKSKKQSLIDIFSKYDIKNTGNMDPDTFKRMCIDMLTSATTISEEDVRKFNDANDIKVVISALDMDGDGAIQKDEFVSWIISGINRSKESRIKFAEKNQLNSRLEMFLSAVEENISKDK